MQAASLGGGDQGLPPSASQSHSLAPAGASGGGGGPHQQSAFAAPEQQQVAALQQQGSMTSSLQGAGSLSQSSNAPPSGRNAAIQVDRSSLS